MLRNTFVTENYLIHTKKLDINSLLQNRPRCFIAVEPKI